MDRTPVIASAAKQSIFGAAARTSEKVPGGASRNRADGGTEDGLLRHCVPRNDA
jgi:hypothetical protein